MITFCFDRMSNPEVLGYPNLAISDLNSDEFDTTWPRTIPCRLFVYFQRHGISVKQCHINDAPIGSWYPVALAWYDFSCDYFSLMPTIVLERLRDRSLKILFYYHEGDNPQNIKHRLKSLLINHHLPKDCYLFVSANSAADDLDRFCFFPDHEFFFHYVNRRQEPGTVDLSKKSYRFTALNRSHKWWRASVMADLHRERLLVQSLWSYNTTIDTGDQEHDNPLELDINPTWRSDVKSFVDRGPYFCDSPDANSHNDHRLINSSLYSQSYCHLILETHFDADGSGGAFITEKTYKCFKFGQPFVMIGPPGTLKVLRDHGYRVFDDVIDNGYDEIQDNTQRWLAVKNTIRHLASIDLHPWYLRCSADIRHNQQHFLSGNRSQLDRLIKRLTTDRDSV
jgi:hypothetical protein